MFSIDILNFICLLYYIYMTTTFFFFGLLLSVPFYLSLYNIFVFLDVFNQCSQLFYFVTSKRQLSQFFFFFFLLSSSHFHFISPSLIFSSDVLQSLKIFFHFLLIFKVHIMCNFYSFFLFLLRFCFF